jgi:hypothetical protein
MEPHWAPAFAAGDVLLSSGKAPLTAGSFAMYRDVGSAAQLRAGNASTCLGQLLELRCGADGLGSCGESGGGSAAAEEAEDGERDSVPPLPPPAAAASAAQLSAVLYPGAARGGAPTHALLLRRARAAGAAGAPPQPCPAGAELLHAAAEPHAPARPPAEWECTAVPVQALLGAVGVRVPRAMFPAVPIFAARRAALAARPPRPRLAPRLVAAARAAGWDAWLPGMEEATRGSPGGSGADAAAHAVACEAARAEADAARAAAAAAPFWRRAAAQQAWTTADAALDAPDGACARAAAAEAQPPAAPPAMRMRLPWRL